jgi:hypothetical protein
MTAIRQNFIEQHAAYQALTMDARPRSWAGAPDDPLTPSPNQREIICWALNMRRIWNYTDRSGINLIAWRYWLAAALRPPGLRRRLERLRKSHGHPSRLGG